MVGLSSMVPSNQRWPAESASRARAARVQREIATLRITAAGALHHVQVELHHARSRFQLALASVGVLDLPAPGGSLAVLLGWPDDRAQPAGPAHRSPTCCSARLTVLSAVWSPESAIPRQASRSEMALVTAKSWAESRRWSSQRATQASATTPATSTTTTPPLSIADERSAMSVMIESGATALPGAQRLRQRRAHRAGHRPRQRRLQVCGELGLVHGLEVRSQGGGEGVDVDRMGDERVHLACHDRDLRVLEPLQELPQPRVGVAPWRSAEDAVDAGELSGLVWRHVVPSRQEPVVEPRAVHRATEGVVRPGPLPAAGTWRTRAGVPGGPERIAAGRVGSQDVERRSP